ncbi:DUF3275 family protein [Carnimonas bestiolae]|uniref:DUF3275 family protein n=1 Tax=Carnimonas bestiolae TaxID=3402172 RepID=UPI003EDC7ED9
MTQRKQKFDIYQAVTDRILASLEQGTIPWVKPWDSAGRVPLIPSNAVSGRQYRGINVLLLMMTAMEQGYLHDRWLTFNQAIKAGGNVRRGEKGTQIALYQPGVRREKDADGNDLLDDNGQPVETHYANLRGYTVFNVAQCDGLPTDMMTPVEPAVPERGPGFNDDIENFIRATGARITMKHGDRACYFPTADRIVLPLREQFDSADGLYSVLLHELGHWTGHPDRLDRPGVSQFDSFGTPQYAFEELVAQLTSAFTCAHFGISNLAVDASYIDAWIQVLKGDKKALIKASGQARTAAEYLYEIAGHQVSPVPLETPAQPAIQDDNQPDREASPLRPVTPTREALQKPQVDGEDVELFGHVWPLGNQVKLDATVARGTFKAQISRLKQLGYVFDKVSQTWSFEPTRAAA